MKFRKSLFVFVILLIGFMNHNFAQDINISGEIRPRFEFRNGYKTPISDGVDPASFISQRTRLNANYGNEVFRSKLVLQNVRVWGDVAQLNLNDVNGIVVHEAWGEVLFSNQFSLKAGRQEIVYDDQRIFGSVGWAQQARSHDAAIFRYQTSEKHAVDFGLAYNAVSETLLKTDYHINSYKTLQFAYYKGNFEHLIISILALNNGMTYRNETLNDTTQEVAYSQTIGPKAEFISNDFNANATFYFQGGKNKFKTDLSAFYFSANANYNVTSKLGIGLGTEYLSGTSTKKQQDAAAADNSFKPFYGTNHKFNGWMDYFYVGGYLFSNGLVDIYLPVTLKFEKLTLKLIPHHFMTAATISTVQTIGQWEDLSNGLGQEIDFTIQYTFSNEVNISAGYSQMLATTSMKVVKGANGQKNNWIWMMLTFKPTFFKNNNLLNL